MIDDTHHTHRVCVEPIESILNKELKVLDKGFIRVVDYMGNDHAVVNAARISYGTGTKSVRNDRNLIRYLLRNKHTTPFEMCEIKLHIKFPMFVAWQMVRHRTANINAYSGRYSIMVDEFYYPEPQHLQKQSKLLKQCREGALTKDTQHDILDTMRNISENNYNSYLHLLEEKGLARELARTVLPFNAYTQWYWKIDAHNLMHFLKLRLDNHAQYEIQAYAKVILDIFKQWLPITYEAFSDYVLNTTYVSAPIQKLLEAQKNGTHITFETSGLSKTEWHEFQNSPISQLFNKSD